MRLGAALALALGALAVTGCESTQEESARLEKAAHRKRVAEHSEEARITTPNATVEVKTAAAVSDSEGSAVVVTVANSGGAQREVPLQFSVAQSGGPPATNTGPGLARSLTSIAYVPAHGSAVWVDDQVKLTGAPGAVTAKLGAGKPAAGAPPRITLGAHHLEAEGAGEALTGSVANDSSVEQHELVVYAVATRGSHPLAAGRAVIASLPPHTSSNYQVFLLGAPTHGAKLTLSAPPSTFG